MFESESPKQPPALIIRDIAPCLSKRIARHRSHRELRLLLYSSMACRCSMSWRSRVSPRTQSMHCERRFVSVAIIRQSQARSRIGSSKMLLEAADRRRAMPDSNSWQRQRTLLRAFRILWRPTLHLEAPKLLRQTTKTSLAPR